MVFKISKYAILCYNFLFQFLACEKLYGKAPPLLQQYACQLHVRKIYVLGRHFCVSLSCPKSHMLKGISHGVTKASSLPILKISGSPVQEKLYYGIKIRMETGKDIMGKNVFFFYNSSPGGVLNTRTLVSNCVLEPKTSILIPNPKYK